MIKDLGCSGKINRFQARMNQFILLAKRKFNTAHTAVEVYASDVILNNINQQRQYNANQVTVVIYLEINEAKMIFQFAIVITKIKATSRQNFQLEEPHFKLF